MDILKREEKTAKGKDVLVDLHVKVDLRNYVYIVAIRTFFIRSSL